MNLSLYVFNVPGFDPTPAIESVKIADKVIIKDEVDLSTIHEEADWIGFLMANEVLQEELAEALPVFMASTYECLVMFKETHGENEVRYYKTPRFFRNKARFNPYDLYPANIDDLKVTRVLNGLIVDSNGKKATA